jgi:hypothetical protein
MGSPRPHSAPASPRTRPAADDRRLLDHHFGRCLVHRPIRFATASLPVATSTISATVAPATNARRRLHSRRRDMCPAYKARAPSKRKSPVPLAATALDARAMDIDVAITSPSALCDAEDSAVASAPGARAYRGDGAEDAFHLQAGTAGWSLTRSSGPGTSAAPRGGGKDAQRVSSASSRMRTARPLLSIEREATAIIPAVFWIVDVDAV